jgi:hypothetical protein
MIVDRLFYTGDAPMFNQTERFIAGMKLRELRKQRDDLRATYDRLSADLAASGDDADRLRRLYDGLREVKFAGRALHPDVANLDVLLTELRLQGSSALLTHWQAALERELEQGRRRSEFVYIFGALLDEWAAASTDDSEAEARSSFAAAMFERLASPNPASNFDAVLEAAQPEQLPPRSPKKDPIRADVEEFELTETLRRLMGNPYGTPELRAEAGRYIEDRALQNELRDALTIMLSNLEGWTWGEAVPTYTVWMRSKWRLLLNPDLATAALLNLLAERWNTALQNQTGVKVLQHLKRLHQQISINPSKTVNDRELRLMREAAEATRGQLWIDQFDPWGTAAPPLDFRTATDDTLRPYLLTLFGEVGSVIGTRFSYWNELQQERIRAYGDTYENGAIFRALRLLNADMRVTRDALPGQPIFVLKADIEQFYPNISHEVILSLLRHVGIEENDLQFFARYLAVPMQNAAGEVVTARRGLPINEPLSHVLADLLLRLMDRFVTRTARVQIIRAVDDITLFALDADELAKGWEALNTFFAACGLTLNESKCGAVGIGAPLPDSLPPTLATKRPTWLMLRLDEDGEWRVDEALYAELLATTRARIERERALLGKVEIYNEAIEFLLASLALDVPLGEVHRTDVYRAIAAFHGGFFESEGIASGLIAAIRERLGVDPAVSIPEGWLYYPITAGGLGLRQPFIVLARYEGTLKERPLMPPVPTEAVTEGWTRVKSSWGTYYNSLHELIIQAEPTAVDLFEARIEDFIARGDKISGGAQGGYLSSYWRWMLYTYGAQILEAFGTFRFLITELVPVQLILRKLREL